MMKILPLFLTFLTPALSLLVAEEAIPPAGGLPSTHARYNPDRKDDFAWENDLVAFRVYGPALAKSKAGEDSGIDCWAKRVSYPIIDRWYALDKKGTSYHEDHGEGLDHYHAGRSRGCGGLGIWQDGEIALSGVYKTWEIIEQKRERTIFNLTYEYQIGADKYHETKRITIELGKRLFRVDATFTKGNSPAVGLPIAIGVATHGGKAKATFSANREWIACWEKIKGSGFGTGIVIDPARVLELRELTSSHADDCNAVAITTTDAAGAVTYYAGYGWEKAGDITTPEAWEEYLREFAKLHMAR